MSSSAAPPHRSLRQRKGSLEVHSVTIWVILLVFLILVLAIIMALRGKGTDVINSTCTSTSGLFGC